MLLLILPILIILVLVVVIASYNHINGGGTALAQIISVNTDTMPNIWESFEITGSSSSGTNLTVNGWFRICGTVLHINSTVVFLCIAVL